jgi:uncharacterized protein
MKAEDVIALLDLKPLPLEGGFYRETYRSADDLPAAALPPRYGRNKAAGTAIYYLLTPNTCSALHRLPTDEVFHFYLGDPVLMLQLSPGVPGRLVTLGNDIVRGQCPQVIVPRGVWQGCFLLPGGAFALLGTTMAPAFDFADYEAADRKTLLGQYPEFAQQIRALTSGEA